MTTRYERLFSDVPAHRQGPVSDASAHRQGPVLDFAAHRQGPVSDVPAHREGTAGSHRGSRGSARGGNPHPGPQSRSQDRGDQGKRRAGLDGGARPAESPGCGKRRRDLREGLRADLHARGG